jgi:mRNA interferase MazF
MPSYSRGEIVLVRVLFSDLSGSKVRPAVVISPSHSSRDLLLVSLTSKTTSLLAGEFVIRDWSSAGLLTETAVKRGIFTIEDKLVLKSLGSLSADDMAELERSMRFWFGL